MLAFLVFDLIPVFGLRFMFVSWLYQLILLRCLASSSSERGKLTKNKGLSHVFPCLEDT